MGIEIAITSGDNPSFDRSVITRGADFGFRGAPTSSEDDRSDYVQVSPECKLDFEIMRALLGCSGGKSFRSSEIMLFLASPSRHCGGRAGTASSMSA
jgi:hypothetical protein